LKLITVDDNVKTNVLGLRDNNFSMIIIDTYGMMMSMITFWARRVDKNCKLLSEFPAVTLRAIC
jgi:hypothetical protein